MTTPSPARCPLCGKPSVPEWRPFCSRGHRDRDLIAWLDEGYRLPGRPLADDSADGAEGLDSRATDD